MGEARTPSSTRRESLRGATLLKTKEKYATEAIEFRDEQIAVLVHGNAVRCGDETRPPLLRLDLIGPDSGLGVGADTSDHLTRFVEDGDAAAQLPHDRVVARDH